MISWIPLSFSLRGRGLAHVGRGGQPAPWRPILVLRLSCLTEKKKAATHPLISLENLSTAGLGLSLNLNAFLGPALEPFTLSLITPTREPIKVFRIGRWVG